jgi:hypothetical protein
MPDEVFSILGYRPTARQAEYHALSRSNYRTLIVSGSGGGKTKALVMETIYQAANTPNALIGYVRRSYPELQYSFVEELGRMDLGLLSVKWNSTKMWLEFPNGSRILCLYAENMVDAYRMAGAQFK